MKIFVDLAFLLILVIAQHGLGSYVFEKITMEKSRNIQNMFGVKSALGQGITSVFFLGLALASEFNQLTILIVLLLGFFLAVRNIRFKEILQGRNRAVVSEKFKSRAFALWLLALSIFLISMLIRMLSRPVSDALAYYLVQPRVIALTEKLTAIKDYENFVQSSAFIEMNLASVYSLSGELCTRMYILYCGLLLLKVVIEICSLLKSSALMKQASIILLITSTFFTNTMADGKTDNISTYWFMSAFAILIIALNKQSTSIFLFVGLLLGLSVLSKVSYATILPGLFAFALYRSKRLQTEKIKQKIALTSLGLLIILLINALKNQIIFSQPLAPFFAAENSNVMLLNQEWFSPENTKWILLMYPLLLIFGKLPMQYGNLSPLILVAIPYFFTRKTERNRVSGDNLAILFTSVISILLWISLKPSVFAPRYIAPAYIFFIIFISFLVSQVIHQMNFNVTLKILVSLVFLQLTLHTTQSSISNDITFYFGSDQDENRLYQEVDLNLESDSLIYLNTYNSGMLSDRALICSSALHDFEIKDSIGSPSDVWGNLYTQGFRIVVTDSNTHKDLPTITAGSLKKDVNFEIRSLKYSSNLTVHTIIDKNNLKTRQRNKC